MKHHFLNGAEQKSASKNPALSGHGSIAVKILCVFAAFCLWVYVMMVESPEHEQEFRDVSVELVNTSAVSDLGLAIYNGADTKIDVTLSGKKSVLSKFDSTSLTATANVGVVEVAGMRYDCAISVDVPSGCKLVKLSRDTVSVYADEEVETSVEIVANYDNVVIPEGYTMGVLEFNDVDRITVKGARQYVSKIDHAIVVPVLSGVPKTTTQTLAVGFVDRNGERIEDLKYLDISTRTVTVTVPVLQKVSYPVRVEFKNGFLNSSLADVNLTPSILEVTGDPERIAEMNFDPVITVDEKTCFLEDGRYNGGKYTLEQTFWTEEYKQKGLTFSQKSVSASIEVSPDLKAYEITVPPENVVETGSRNDVKATWEKQAVVVTLLGNSDEITKITADDIQLQLDTSPYMNGSQNSAQIRAKVLVDSVYKDNVLVLGNYDFIVQFTND